jgi:hypothetical protein
MGEGDAYCADNTAPRLTITEDNDFTHLQSSANKQGQVTVTIWYLL